MGGWAVLALGFARCRLLGDAAGLVDGGTCGLLGADELLLRSGELGAGAGLGLAFAQLGSHLGLLVGLEGGDLGAERGDLALQTLGLGLRGLQLRLQHSRFAGLALQGSIGTRQLVASAASGEEQGGRGGQDDAGTTGKDRGFHSAYLLLVLNALVI